MNGNDEVYLAVGRAILDFAPLEIMAHRLAWTGLDPLDDTVGRTKTKALQLAGVLRIIETRAAKNAYGRYVVGGDERARAFVERCRELADARGVLAHSFVDGGRLGRVRNAIKKALPLLAVTKAVNLDSVLGLPDAFLDLRDQGGALWREVENAAKG